MKKLFALISLLGLVAGMGGALNAQDAVDQVEFRGDFQRPGEDQAISFRFSATPGEKFIIRWHLGHFDTIDVKTSDELEATYTFSKEYTDQHSSFGFDFLALSSTGHIRNFHIDSNNRYTGLIFLDCPLLDTAHIVHNDLKNLDFRNCPALTFVDCSYNKLIYSFFRQDSNWFPNLTYLDCSHNDIEALIATDCITLQTLDCSYNPNLKILRTVDLKALKSLNCSNTQLTSLYLSNLSALQTLNCNNTQLSSLGVSELPALQTLNCSNNLQLTSLAIENTSLTSLDILNDTALEWLNCGYNQLDKIDLSSNKNLNTLYCSYNQLVKIDLSSNKKLEILYCSHNQLSSLNLPENLTLGQISCDSNRISSLSVLAALRKQAQHGILSPQFVTAALQVGNVLNLQGEMYIGNRQTDLTLLDSNGNIIENMCDILADHGDGLLYFKNKGQYRLQLYNEFIDQNYSATQLIVYYDLTVVDSVVRPQFSIPSGAVLPDTALVLSTPTPDARIYYTTDGSEPDGNALLYQEPIRITEAVTIKAIAIQDTFKSHIATATYTMDTVARPTFSIASGKVKRGTTVSLNTTTPNARIIYTTDGSTPNEKDALEYAAPIRITEAMTVKAVAIYKTLQSQVASASYTIDSVANEHDSRVSKLRVYAKDRTIYLSETVGEIEVFTMNGHCVYRGFDTAISVWKSGMYIVSAAGKRWKVAVR